MKDLMTLRPSGGMILTSCILVPCLGCFLTVLFNDLIWLWLLIPLIIFMEGGIFLIAVIVVIMSWIIGG